MSARRNAPLLCAWAAAGLLQGQQLFDSVPGSPLRLLATDVAVLGGDENRDDIDCSVEPLKPRLDFDLKYTAGYAMRLPAAAVSPDGEQLRVLFRVQPLGTADAGPVYFRQTFDVPARREHQDGTGWFQGLYFLGPGRYKVDWLMRDLQGRVCSAHWRTRAPRPGYKDRPAAAAPANLVAPYRSDIFLEEPPVARARAPLGGLHVRVLLNLAPLDRSRFKISDYELASLVGMLRSLHREPSIGLFSLTAFHAYDRRVVYRAERATRLDFPALGKAVRESPAGLVDAEALADEAGEQRFLAELLNAALAPSPLRADAVVVLGFKVEREAGIPRELLSVPAGGEPVFRFTFNRSPRSYPWPGAIEAALAPYGLTTHSITGPQDYTRAVASLLDRIERSPAGAAHAEVERP